MRCPISLICCTHQGARHSGGPSADRPLPEKNKLTHLSVKSRSLGTDFKDLRTYLTQDNLLKVKYLTKLMSSAT